jgi:type II secretory pathway pseudopilin PulG
MPMGLIERRPDGGESGTTLTELLAAVALLTVVLAALVPVLSIARGSWDRTDRHTELLQNARPTLDRLVRDLRSAQSFAEVSPTAIRFTRALGDGSGATPVVEYRLNAATNNLEYRTGASYVFRRRITVTAGTAVPAGYSVSIVFNHAALVAARRSLASGNDVRIVYWTGSRWQELDRFNFNFTATPTAWNTRAVRLWFRLQTPIAAGTADNNYYLHYGDLSAARPPANADYIFMDYEDGTDLAGWTRRDPLAGTKSPSGDGFVFNASSASGYRQFSKNVPHGNVEIIWGFRSDGPAAQSSTRHVVGVSARRSNTGAGYMIAAGESTNTQLRLARQAGWTATPTFLGAPFSLIIVRGADYYGRFSLVGSQLRAKVWLAAASEPGWALTATDANYSSGLHYGQVDGIDASATSPQNHRHRHLIVRLRVADPEPTTALAAEEAAPAPAAWQPLAGPFRAMDVQCFNAAGSAFACPAGPGPNAAAVRSVLVTLTAMDPTGEVADLVLTSRAYRQTP